MNTRELIIQNYVKGYNEFDIDRMVADFDADIVFENISNGETNMVLHGIAAFRDQAGQATTYFSERKQAIRSFVHQDDETEIQIDYHAILAVDFPNGMKKGDVLNLQGRSVFRFAGDKIIKLIDIS